MADAEPPKEKQCNICYMLFKNEPQRLRHMRVHERYRSRRTNNTTITNTPPVAGTASLVTAPNIVPLQLPPLVPIENGSVSTEVVYLREYAEKDGPSLLNENVDIKVENGIGDDITNGKSYL